jgi:hypothetical protein
MVIYKDLSEPNSHFDLALEHHMDCMVPVAICQQHCRAKHVILETPVVSTYMSQNFSSPAPLVLVLPPHW